MHVLLVGACSGSMTTAMDPRAARFLAMVALGGGDGNAPVGIAERRRSFARLMRFSPVPEGDVAVVDRAAPGCGGHAIPVRLYVPKCAIDPAPALVFFHGGGLVAGDLDTHDALCRALAIGACCRILSVGYRLAPEHPFPAAILDGYAAVRFSVREAAALGIDPARIAVGGDSGGGTLAAIVAGVLGRRHALAALVLICPVLDHAAPRPSRQRFAAGHLLDATTMAADLAHYRPRRPLDDPRISPFYADPAALPPVWLHTAGFDPLRDEGHAYAARLREAGAAVRHTDHPDLIHGFYGLTGPIPAAVPAVAAIARDIGDALCRSGTGAGVSAPHDGADAEAAVTLPR